MTDKDRFIRYSDIKRKLRYIFKQYGVPQQMQKVYLDAMEKLPYTLKAKLEQTLQTEKKELKPNELDKIGAEIEQQRKEASNKHSEDAELQAYYDGLNDGLKDARDIIDKYRVESEVNTDECNL